jgi:single-stranded-DNA-specific exonuclease
VRLGLDAMRSAPRPGIAALMEAARIERRRISPETLAFGLIPRLNAMGRIGDASRAASLLLTDDAGEATVIAGELEDANAQRRELLTAALEQARAQADAAADAPVIVIAGPWPAGIIGLVAGRLADERGRPAIVFCDAADPWRGSMRSSGFDLIGALSTMPGLFERFGGHAAAAGCHMAAANVEEFRRRMHDLAADLRPVEPSLELDLVIDALEIDYRLLADLSRLEPAGAGNPLPLVGIRGLVVSRVRRASGGHTQLVLRKGAEVVDGICFGRDDLADSLDEGACVDLVARLDSRSFGGFESIQLEVRDVAPAGALESLAIVGAGDLGAGVAGAADDAAASRVPA